MQDQYGKPTMKLVQEAGNEVTTSKSTFERFLEGKATSTTEEDETALKTSDEFARKPSKVDQIAIQNMEKNEIKYIEEGETATQTIEEDEKTMKERNGLFTVVSDSVQEKEITDEAVRKDMEFTDIARTNTDQDIDESTVSMFSEETQEKQNQ